MIQKKTLSKLYKDVCNEYVRLFCKKQGLDFDGWVGNEVGGIAAFSSQYFFGINDIVLDIDTDQKKYLILEWQSDVVEHNMFSANIQNINYKSYTMGLRYEHLSTSSNNN